MTSFTYAGDPVNPPANAPVKKALPELRLSGTQIRSTPALKNEVIKATLDKIKANTLPPVAAEHTRVVSAQLEGIASCNARVSFRAHVVGGTRTGPHTLVYLRMTVGGLVPQFDQRSVEVSLAPGDERDVLLTTDWLLKCSTTNNGLFNEQRPEPFFLAVVPESVAPNAPTTAQPDLIALLYPPAQTSWSYKYHPDLDLRRLLGG